MDTTLNLYLHNITLNSYLHNTTLSYNLLHNTTPKNTHPIKYKKDAMKVNNNMVQSILPNATRAPRRQIEKAQKAFETNKSRLLKSTSPPVASVLRKDEPPVAGVCSKLPAQLSDLSSLIIAAYETVPPVSESPATEENIKSTNEVSMVDVSSDCIAEL